MFAMSGTMTFDPADRDELVKTLVALCEASRRDEGNVDYWFAEDLAQPATFHFFEQWSSDEAFNQHCQTPNYTAFMETWLPRCKGASAARHEISESKSLTG
jgi:quinol monooxygenase YgiN